MDEDGMFVNFSVGNEDIGTKFPARGGRWKERRIAKKVLQNQYQKPQPRIPASTGDESLTTPETNSEAFTERSYKRRKLNIPAEATNSSRAKSSKDVVSSIFSSNPSTGSTNANLPTQDDHPASPSNAPLPALLNSFTSLGLSPIVSTHLLTKLSLKAPTLIQKSTLTQLLRDDSDAFIQAETGSGKTLAYLLPIVQRMMGLSLPAEEKDTKKTRINRNSGLFAIILAPTRELCKQISIVLENLLRCASWIVPGTVIGGEKKKSEKARLRKGLNILVATPGRLVDHLDNTKVLDVSQVRWLVLDEGDRLVELGFEEDIKRIVQELEKRSKARGSDEKDSVQGLPVKRTTVLCSATMKMTVQRLGEISLKDAVHIKAEPSDDVGLDTDKLKESKETTFLAPAQLKQSYTIVPPKQRLVTLAAFLKHTFARKGSVMKAIVFLSCADSVDFHFEVFARKSTSPNTKDTIKKPHPESDKENTDSSLTSTVPEQSLTTVTQSDVLASTPNPNLALHKLHGSLTQQTRTATLAAFTRSTNPSILLCTDVASRGLDLPNIDLVIEYDPPFSSEDHLHRIGRTARAGREGRAVIFLMPGPEEGYVEILRQGYRDGIGRGLIRNEAEDILKKGFGNAEAALAIDKSSVQGRDWSERAEHWQLEAERWVIEDSAKAGAMAKKAFVSHVRAYATHVVKERVIFDVKELHLGHLAKAFGLRERPGHFGRGDKAKGARRDHGARKGGKDDAGPFPNKKVHDRDREASNVDGRDAARKMQSKMKEHLAGANEFNIG
ncbi:MAG: hypothetical protein Q9219_005231 [cf. Caloplaca sp. 3 TL-2023]